MYIEVQSLYVSQKGYATIMDSSPMGLSKTKDWVDRYVDYHIKMDKESVTRGRGQRRQVLEVRIVVWKDLQSTTKPGKTEYERTIEYED